MIRRTVLRFALVLAAAVAARPASAGVTVIAPFLEGQSYCDEARAGPDRSEDEAAALCLRAGHNGAKAIAAALDAIGPARSPSGRYALGYTFIMPLLRFYTKTPQGWRIDPRAIDLALSTVADIDRPVVLHLSATHFNFEGQALAAELGADPRNLMSTQAGPLGSKAYFNTPIYAWTLADADAPVNHMRREAFQAVLDGVCRLPEPVRARIAAVSFLGETHQLFPDLQGGGAGYDRPFLITDYAPAAVAGFRAWLKARFGTVDALNTAVGGHYLGFDAVEPPRADHKGEANPDRLAHLDAQAAGLLAVFGWAADPGGPRPHMELYVDGRRVQDAPADLNRLDVLEARPDLGTRAVGWRFDLDYRGLAPGMHTLTVLARLPSDATPYLVGERRIHVLGQRPAGAIAPRPIPATHPPGGAFSAFLDRPGQDIQLLYNPLARLWDAYRQAQVLAFQEGFAKLARASCIPAQNLFSHQIAPAFYPDYDPEKFAVDASLKANPLYAPGVTLYGSGAYEDQFLRVKAAAGWTRYGLAEFHPLVALTPAQYTAMFDRHNLAGAAYIAPYYLSTRVQHGRNDLVRRLIAPDNPQQGSADLYRALQALMRTH